MLPAGNLHLVFRMTDGPLHILGEDGSAPAQRIGTAVIGGARTRFYVRERAMHTCSVGAVLRPGAAERLFGVPADELSGCHTSLDDVWGAAGREMRERLMEVEDAGSRVALLETLLTERLAALPPPDAAAIRSVDTLPRLPSVAEAARQAGTSHRAFLARFRRSVGLTPKKYLRILRFQRALQLMRGPRPPGLATIAGLAGFSDQAHFNHDFLDLAGVTPSEYLRRRPRETNHLPVDAGGEPRDQIPPRPEPRATG